MAGLAGCIVTDPSVARRVLARMALAPAARGRSMRRARLASLCVFGANDVDLAEDEGRRAALAVSGHVRLDGRPADAVALLDAWCERGDRVLDDLGGEVSVAVFVDGRVVLARDALGTRPMYVADLPGGGVAFSTSLFALVYAGARADIDHDAVVRSLALGYPTAPATALAGVRQLGPGEIWQLAPRRTRTRWFVPRERLDRARTLEEATAVVDDVVTRAVTDAIPARGRVGAFLSGGIDSSIVLARVKESGTPVEAFTLFFGAELPGEMRYARAVAQHLGVRQNVLEVDAAAFVAGIEPSVLHLEDVVSEAIAIPNFLLAREASRACDVLFTGEGGDQSFGGPKNLGMMLAYAYAGHPCAQPLAHTYVSLFQYLWNDLGDALEPRVLSAFDPEALADDVGRRFFDERRPLRGGSFVGRVMIGNTVVKGGSNILVKAAKMIGFAHDVGLRSPMFDRRVVDLAFTIPPWQKLDGGEEKLVLRRASLRSLPAWVVNRPKRGMTLPLTAWFDGALGAMARDVLTERAVRERGLFRREYVARLLERKPLPRDHARARTTDKLWLALVTELHHRSIDRIAREARALGAGPVERTTSEVIHA
jgi:asparagine synthase (glutamine-hydrolysing)